MQPRLLALFVLPLVCQSMRRKRRSSSDSAGAYVEYKGHPLQEAHPANFGKPSDDPQYINLRVFRFDKHDNAATAANQQNRNWGDLAWVCTGLHESVRFKSLGYRFGHFLSVYTVKVLKKDVYSDYVACSSGKCGSLTLAADHAEFGYKMQASSSHNSGCEIGDEGLVASDFGPDNYGRDRFGSYRWYSLMTPLNHSNPSQDTWQDAHYEGTVDMTDLFPPSDLQNLGTIFPNQKRQHDDQMLTPTSLDIIASRIKGAIGISWPAGGSDDMDLSGPDCRAGSDHLCSCSQLLRKHVVQSFDDCSLGKAAAACESRSCYNED